MLKLYDFLTSGNCYKVHLLLAQLGTPYERVELPRDGGTKTPGYGAINPLGKVPALEVEPGRILTESSAILCYLADGTKFMPADALGRADAIRWLLFEQQYVLPNLGLARFMVKMLGSPPDKRDAIAQAQEGGREALQHMENHLQSHDWVAGTAYSIADIGLYAYVHLAGEAGVDLTPYPAVRGWLDRVKAQPGYVELGNPQP